MSFLAGFRYTRMDYKLELVLVPVTDVDRAKKFYLENMGFVPDGNIWLLQEVDRSKG